MYVRAFSSVAGSSLFPIISTTRIGWYLKTKCLSQNANHPISNSSPPWTTCRDWKWIFLLRPHVKCMLYQQSWRGRRAMGFLWGYSSSLYKLALSEECNWFIIALLSTSFIYGLKCMRHGLSLIRDRWKKPLHMHARITIMYF